MVKRSFASLKRSINNLNRKKQKIQEEIALAEEKFESVINLKDSPNSRERLVYLSAELELKNLRYSLAYTNTLLTTTTYELEELQGYKQTPIKSETAYEPGE